MRKQIAAALDYAVLNPETTIEHLIAACELAWQEGFASVCVRPCDVRKVAMTPVTISTVVGFPHGSNTIGTKVFEAKEAVDNGADEIDMVINLGRWVEGEHDYAYREIGAVRDVVPHLKVILETCYLTDREITLLCKEAAALGADFVKTSTGYGSHGATTKAVKLMVEALKNTKTQVKASGGIDSYQKAERFLSLGCTRLGSSKWVELLPNSYRRILNEPTSK